MVSHISHVELGSPWDTAATPPLAELAALKAEAPLATLIACGMRLGIPWCTLVGRVDKLEIRLCLLLSCSLEPLIFPTGLIPVPARPMALEAGPCPMSSRGSEMGIRMESWMKALGPPSWRRLETARA
jgi:hypothetical protein